VVARIHGNPYFRGDTPLAARRTDHEPRIGRRARHRRAEPARLAPGAVPGKTPASRLRFPACVDRRRSA